MKMIFVVFDIEQDGKRYAVADTIRTGQNLAAYLQRYNSSVCHLCESRKEAEEIALDWNECHKRNGDSIFEEAVLAELYDSYIKQ